MAYKVRFTAPAEADAYTAYERIQEAGPRSAEKWLRELFAAVQTLEEMPARCQVISESEELGYPVRHLLYGKRTGIHRIIFDIQEESEEGPRVRILRIWHGARDAISVQDLKVED